MQKELKIAKKYSKFACKASNFNISNDLFPKVSLSIISTLQQQGFEALFVGGCVRDLLSNLPVKDFDIVTDATPEEIKKIFKSKCRIIGRRFRLSHILAGKDIYEVATFRSEPNQAENHQIKERNGHILQDNFYSKDILTDAKRRDFSINALYLDPTKKLIYDFFKGINDLKTKKLTFLKEPNQSFLEDPVRMIRAIRFANKLNIKLEPSIQKIIIKNAPLLQNIAKARLFEEILKLIKSKTAVANINSLHQYKLLTHLLPQLEKGLNAPNSNFGQMINLILVATSNRIEEKLHISTALIMACLFWYPLIELTKQIQNQLKIKNKEAFILASREMANQLNQTLSIPKIQLGFMKEIWLLQNQLAKREIDITQHKKFRPALHLLNLRAEIEGGKLHKLATWWQNLTL